MNTALNIAMKQNPESESTSVTVRDAIYSRRAVRHYLPKAVNDIQVKNLIDAAIHAPSAMNRQPWAFVIVQRPTTLKRISDAAKIKIMNAPLELHNTERRHTPFVDPTFDIFYGAPTLIVICAKEEHGMSALGDCYLAAQNLMLEAYEMGLATCPIGLAQDVLCEDTWKDELLIPQGYAPVLPIIVGYPGSEMPTTQRAVPKIFSWLR